MRRRFENYRLPIMMASILCATAAFLVGCGERDVPSVSDETQIKNYMNSSEDAVELFALDSLNPVSFTIPSRPGSYREVVDSIQRSMTISFSKSTVDAGSIGNVREAIVNVTDDYYVTTTKYLASDTTTLKSKRSLVRNAHFLKIGDDSRPFVGWKLFGFSGYDHGGLSIPVGITLTDSSDNVEFNGDESLFRSSPFGSDFHSIPTIKLEDMSQISPGTRIVVDAESDTAATSKVFLTFISPYSSGEDYHRMDSLTLYHAVDTIVTPAGTDISWHTVTFASYDFLDNWPKVRVMWSVPFRTKF